MRSKIPIRLLRPMLLLVLLSSQVLYATDRCATEVQSILKDPNLDDGLRKVMENGKTGDGIHHPWMDQMKQVSVQEVSFSIAFSKQDSRRSVRVGKVDYLRHYLRFDSRIEDKKALHRIHRSSLEKNLRPLALAEARLQLPTVTKRIRSARGTIYIAFFDNECVPRLALPPEVKNATAAVPVATLAAGEAFRAPGLSQ